MKHLSTLMASIAVGCSCADAQYAYSNVSVANSIYSTYQKHSNAAMASGYRYKSQQEKNQTLQWIRQQIQQAESQGTDYTPQHKAHIKALRDGYAKASKIPVDPSGGTGNWGGTPQQRADEALKMGQQFIKDYEALMKQFEQARQQAMQQMAKDNAAYAALLKQGVKSLQNTGQSGLNTLDAIEAAEERERQIAAMQSQLNQSIALAMKQEIIDQLKLMGKGWDDYLAMAGSIPGLNDPTLLKALEDLKNFVALNPDDIAPSGPETRVREGGIVTENGIFIPTDDNGNYLDPREAPWGIYYGDEVCDNREGIEGPGRDAAIAEFDRLNSDYPDDPRKKPALHYPDDVLSSVTGIATGPSRQRAIEEFDKQVSQIEAEKQAAAAQEKAAAVAEAEAKRKRTTVIPGPHVPVHLQIVPRSPNPNRTAPTDEPSKKEPENESNRGNPVPDDSWSSRIPSLDEISDKADNVLESIKSLNPFRNPLDGLDDAIDDLSSPGQ